MHEDLELVVRLSQGDESAMDAILASHEDAVVRFARTVTGDEAAALDAAQEAFIRLWRNPGSFKGGSLRAWLFTVTRNVALNQLRSTKRHTGRLQKVAEPPPLRAADEQAEAAERLEQVRAFIATLPEQERVAITLFAGEGMSQGEVAEVLGTTTGAVKQAILSARKKLRERFEDSA